MHMHLQYIVKVVCDQKCAIFVLFIHQKFQSQNHFLEICVLCVCVQQPCLPVISLIIEGHTGLFS